MKSVIIHTDGRVTNLAAAIDADTYAELETGRYSRTSPALWCGTCGGSIYIRHGANRTGELFGAHHRATGCGADLTIRRSGLSDEHKYQAEYHAQAAEHAGSTAELEVRTTGQTRVDVVIDGRVGIEVQRSALKKAAAIDRTARSMAAGLASVSWFTDRTSSPQWTGHVPGYRTTMPTATWKTLPAHRTATAAGLRTIRAVRCGTERPCPHQRHGSCGRFIPAEDAWIGLYVDDVVEGLADGLIRPVRLGPNVQLLSVASIGLYEDLTGERLTYDPGLPRVALPPSDRVECALSLRMPSDAPAPVREWFEAELARVQAEREEREQAEREEQARREQAEREPPPRSAPQRMCARCSTPRWPDSRACAKCGWRDITPRIERQAADPLDGYSQLLHDTTTERDRREQLAYERAAREREAAREQQELVSYDQRIRQQIEQKREQKTWCQYPHCREHGHPYINGTWCDQHAKKMEFRLP
jgi:hypothetical protein